MRNVKVQYFTKINDVNNRIYISSMIIWVERPLFKINFNQYKILTTISLAPFGR